MQFSYPWRMKPVVILDSNALYGRKAFTHADSLLLQALSEFDHLRLLVPEVVLHELARQWAEEVQQSSADIRAAAKKLNEAFADVDKPAIPLDLPEHDREVFYDHAKRLLHDKHAETPPLPEVLVEDLLIKEIDVRKPFSRQGTGFRDALIWETIRRVCDELPDPAVQVLLITNNYKDFCDKKGGNLHPDLRQDLSVGQAFDIVPSIHHLLNHPAVAPLLETRRVLDETFTGAHLEKLVDQAIADLHRLDVNDVLGVYVGSGVYEVPIGTGLDEATFDEIMYEESTISAEIYRTGDELTIRVSVDASCSFEGFADKSRYLYDDENSDIKFLEDWNNHVYRASAKSQVRFVFSATFTENTRDNVTLDLDDAEEI